MSNVNIKSCFISRWGDRGRVIEADFSQLEVIGAAFISGDTNMYEDILKGVDSHSQSASWLNPYSYEEIRKGYLDGDKFFEKMRKNAKGPRFELQYGAGAKSIAENNNLTQEQAQGFIDQYYGRYAELKAFQDGVIDTVKASRKPSERRTPLNKTSGMGEYVSITGRRYRFFEQDAPEWFRKRGTDTSFSPTQCKNYPIQGFATGDVVPEVLGRVFRALINHPVLHDKCLIINTVHDSIIFDCHIDYLDMACALIKELMEDAPSWMQERYGFWIDLPLAVDVEYGISWDKLEKWDG